MTAVPLKVTAPVPRAAPKLVPLMVTEAPSGPATRLNPVIAGVTAKDAPLLATLSTVTTTLPEVAPAGTSTVIEVSLQLLGDPLTPLKATVEVPRVAPKFAPVTLTVVPTGPEVGFKEPMIGSVPTVKETPLLACPPTVTTTGPVVAPAGAVTVIDVSLQLVGVAVTPLKVTVDVPCVAPKLLPLISTVAPSRPEIGLNRLIAGLTVKGTPLLATLSTVTTTGPVATPVGAVAVIEVSLQLV